MNRFISSSKYILVVLSFLGFHTGEVRNSHLAKSPQRFANQVVVDVAHRTAAISPTMFGIFFEDINLAADGGIYAELIKNRSFEFDDPLMGWSQPASNRWSNNQSSGFASAINRGADNPNGHFLQVKVRSDENYVLMNEGFRGIGFKEGMKYQISLEAKVEEGNPRITLELLGSDSTVLGAQELMLTGKEWRNYQISIQASGTDAKGIFRIRFHGISVVDLDMISMFPSDTWRGRKNGLRNDLVQLLADLHPGFVRFPGGCIVEGRTLEQRYQWKKTVGPVEERTTLINRWNTEFSHRSTPDYFQSFGLGFFEYFQLAEDLGAEPLPILSCGMACQFNTGELVPMDELDPYVQDALDLIEFANGPATSIWGKVRAGMGHPEPFHLKMIGVGNEQWGTDYFDRYQVFEAAIKSKYPDIRIVSGSGPFAEGEMFEYGWEALRQSKADFVDEHYYKPPQWFLDHGDRYDSYDRQSPRIFAGEYAAHDPLATDPLKKNDWRSALSEAAFMTGLLRNADLVQMCSYAPLFAHVDGWQWTPDLIWFDNLQSYGTPNYYVQKLYANNRGSHVLEMNLDGKPMTGQNGLFGAASWDEKSGELIFTLVNTAEGMQELPVHIQNAQSVSSQGTRIVLRHADLLGANSLMDPDLIVPEETMIPISGVDFTLVLEGQSLTILRVQVER